VAGNGYAARKVEDRLLRETHADEVAPGMMRRIVACHECDALQTLDAGLKRGEVALCAHCRAVLFRYLPPNAVDRSLALHLAALILFLTANLFPLLRLRLGGMETADKLMSGPEALWAAGHPALAALVFLTSFLFPMATMLGALYLLLPAWRGRRAPALGPVYRLVRRLMPWSMVGVFMLGVIVAAVKLMDMASLEFGIAMAAFAALLPVLVVARMHFNSELFWPSQREISGFGGRSPRGKAGRHGLLHCPACSYLTPPAERCPRCGQKLSMRKADSLNRTWALLVTGVMLFIPANLFPVMTIERLGREEASTILGGVGQLVNEGMWGIALIVFFASLVVPVSKFVAMGFLLGSVHRRSAWRPADRTRLHRITEMIGAWSMVDVYVIALLTSLVDFGALARIRPDIGAGFFAATVVVTMLAARSFDSRLLWDALDGTMPVHSGAEVGHA